MQWKPQTTPVHAVLLLFALLLVWHSKLRTVKDNTMIKEGTRIDGSQQFKNTSDESNIPTKICWNFFTIIFCHFSATLTKWYHENILVHYISQPVLKQTKKNKQLNKRNQLTLYCRHWSHGGLYTWMTCAGSLEWHLSIIILPKELITFLM